MATRYPTQQELNAIKRSAEEGDESAASYLKLLEACTQVLENSNGISFARGLVGEHNDVYGKAIDDALSELMPVIFEAAAGGWESLKYYVPDQGKENLAEDEEEDIIICPGCGGEFKPEDMAILPDKVNLCDGSKREILFDGRTCCDFWDDSNPGDWVPLVSGEEVQLVNWRCSICDGVYDHGMVERMIDTEYDDGSTALVCSFCRKKDKEGRFQAMI